MEIFLHGRLGNECHDLVLDWIHRGLVIAPDDGRIETLAEEMQDLAETGKAIMM